MRAVMAVFFVALSGIAGAVSADQALTVGEAAIPTKPATAGRVIDGDTLDIVVDGETLRAQLVGVDAPQRGQPHHTDSARILKRLVEGRPLRVTLFGTDRYRRTLTRLYDGKVDINRELIRLGAAWVFKDDRGNADLQSAQAEAREEKRGLWALPNPIDPDDWRAGKR